MLETLQHQPQLFYGLSLVLGLCLGSFINVVAHRLPIMLDQLWKHECYDYLKLSQPAANDPSRPFNLCVPASECPNCQQSIKWYDNLPVLSFLVLRARCRHCQQPISWHYPLVELLTALMSLAVAYRFGVTWQCVGGLALTWILLSQSLIDAKHLIIPDEITLPALWLGLCLNLWHVFTPLQNAVIGAMAGYLSLWSIYWLFKLITGKEGMGYGDFKLLAMLGAWLGWEPLFAIVFLSSTVGAVVGVALILLGKHQRQHPIPFGPYLALAGWIELLFGNTLNKWYLESLRFLI